MDSGDDVLYNYQIWLDLLSGVGFALFMSVIVVFLVFAAQQLPSFLGIKHKNTGARIKVLEEYWLNKNKMYLIDIDGSVLLVAEHEVAGMTCLARLPVKQHDVEESSEYPPSYIPSVAPNGQVNLQDAVNVAMKLQHKV